MSNPGPHSDVTTLVASMTSRDPDGEDARYLEWHALDHRPEQHRLPGMRGSFRVVSTPECRAARLASEGPFDEVDHVMAYLFADRAQVGPWRDLGGALFQAGRMPHRLPSVEIGVWDVAGMAAAPRVEIGADVLPWRPARGAYLLVEPSGAPAGALVDVDGVAGVWWARDDEERQLTVAFLDDDPLVVAARLRPALEARDLTALLSGPFHTVVPFAWDRHLP